MHVWFDRALDCVFIVMIVSMVLPYLASTLRDAYEIISGIKKSDEEE